MRTSSRRGLFAAALLAVPALLVGASTPTADAATTDHRRSFVREVEPWIPGSPPSTPPAVKLTAACVRRVGGGELEAVFGYKNLSPLSVYAGLDPHVDIPEGNVIVRETRRRRGPHRTAEIEVRGPQATLFLPGTHRHVFAVRFKSNQTVAWRVRVPSFDDPVIDPGWKVTVEPRRHARCAAAGARPLHRRAGRRDELWADQRPGRQRWHHRVRRRVRRPVRERRLQRRWESSSLQRGRRVDDRTESGATAASARSSKRSSSETARGSRCRKRAYGRVVDVFEPVEWFGPIADVTGRCAFRGEVVKSEVFWAGQPATGSITPVVVAGAVVRLEATAVLREGSGSADTARWVAWRSPSSAWTIAAAIGLRSSSF